MKVRKNTDHTLIVEETPWLFAILILVIILVFTGIGLSLAMTGEWIGLLFLGFGVLVAPLALFAFARRVQVVFYRPDAWVEVRRANLLRKSKARYALGDVKGAILESTQSDNGTLYRVTLKMKVAGIPDDKPLTEAYTNVGNHRAVADAINTWLGTG